MSKKRIAINILAAYTRNAVGILCGIFAIRWSYNALGKESYGLVSVVGSILAFSGMFTSLMSSSNSRFFAVAIGEGRRLGAEFGRRELKIWFNTTFSVHLLMAIVLCTAILPVGEFLIRHRLKIPDGRMDDALVVFRISATVLFFSFLKIPFEALFKAKQLIFVRSVVGVARSLLTTAEAFWLLHFGGNRLVGHSIAFAGIQLLTYAVFCLLALRLFPECSFDPRLWFDRKRIGKLFSYTSFTLFSNVGGFFAIPVTNMIVNVHFGAGANALIGIGQRVSAKLEILSGAIISAVFPEVASRIGAKETKRAEKMAVLMSFLSTLLSCVVGVPLLFWIDALTKLLLGNPPEGTPAMVGLLLAVAMTLRLTTGYQMLVRASGRVKWYEMAQGTVNMSCPLVFWICLCAGLEFLPALYVGWLLPRIVLSLQRVAFAAKLVKANPALFFRYVLGPVSVCLGTTCLVCAPVREASGGSLWWLFPAMGINAILVGTLVWKLHPASEIRSLPGRILSRFPVQLPARRHFRTDKAKESNNQSA